MSGNECLMNDALYAVRCYDDYPRFMCIRVLSLCQYGRSCYWTKGDDYWLYLKHAKQNHSGLRASLISIETGDLPPVVH